MVINSWLACHRSLNSFYFKIAFCTWVLSMRMCFLLHCFSSGYSWLSPGSCPWGCRHSSPRCFQSPAHWRKICAMMTCCQVPQPILWSQLENQTRWHDTTIYLQDGSDEKCFVSWFDACHVPSRRAWCRPHKRCSRLLPVVASGHTCVTKDNFLWHTCIHLITWYIPVYTRYIPVYTWYTPVHTCIYLVYTCIYLYMHVYVVYTWVTLPKIKI